MNQLKFYDGIFGLLLKQTEKTYTQYPDALNMNFVDAWKYEGVIYRVLHSRRVKNNKTGKISYKLPKVKYHKMISHWTTDYSFEALHKLSRTQKYVILEANTKEHLGFDVNKFRKIYRCINVYTQNEQEIIFPMYKECIKEYHMSINEFIEMKKMM